MSVHLTEVCNPSFGNRQDETARGTRKKGSWRRESRAEKMQRQSAPVSLLASALTRRVGNEHLGKSPLREAIQLRKDLKIQMLLGVMVK